MRLTARMNGIVSTSKVMLRHSRDVHNSKQAVYVSSCQQRLSPYLPSIGSSLVQKRWTSAAKALVDQDKQRFPKSDIPATAAPRFRRRTALLLRTLDQTRLDVGDFVDITGEVEKSVRSAAAPEQPSFHMGYSQSGPKHIPFPPDSQGFIYWHLEPDAPPVSGQLRFRTTASSDPTSFPSGRDLQLPDGRTWNISLFEIARRSKYSCLRAHLLSEELVTAEVLDTGLNICGLEGTRTVHPGPSSLLIWKFGQSFLVDFQSPGVGLWIMGSSAAERLRLERLFSFRMNDSGSTGRIRSVDYTPFTGRALVQFEHSTLPEHKGTRTVVLRFVKIIELTKAEGSNDVSGMPEPKEGGLAMAHARGSHHWRPWSVNVDRHQPGGKQHSLSRALSILFDNEAGSPR
ncbi:hypothetical protein OE88DRAFT_1043726 [Heliocybe sulcata]|uniref:Uncharacterized protein n=1 Tax=Heliocybe sulcata TaxID=5364 RepID=A0A5C3MQ81_9AGAM|nr:hypothetical protein OE88DRAFT_1043726 [Heliocybe sulcata]